MKNYIIITPCKDEEKNLPSLFNSVLKQTIKPKLWVIVDDSSTDNSKKIIQKFATKTSFIKLISHSSNNRDLSKYSSVVKTGCNYAEEYCKKNKTKHDFIGILDADIILEKNYYKKLIQKFNKYPKLGIASGIIFSKYDDKLIYEKTDLNFPRGGIRLLRKKCYNSINGMPLVKHAPDSVCCAKAKLNNWITMGFQDVKAIQIRPTSSAQGFWKGFKIRGESDYYLGYNPIFALLKGIKYLITRPNYKGIAFFYGYFSSLVSFNDKINDVLVRNYFFYSKSIEKVQKWF